MNVQKLKATFEAVYSKTAEALYFSPGLIQLIGEHTDYNMDLCFPVL